MHMQPCGLLQMHARISEMPSGFMSAFHRPLARKLGFKRANLQAAVSKRAFRCGCSLLCSILQYVEKFCNKRANCRLQPPTSVTGSTLSLTQRPCTITLSSNLCGELNCLEHESTDLATLLARCMCAAPWLCMYVHTHHEGCVQSLTSDYHAVL